VNKINRLIKNKQNCFILQHY